MSDIPPTTRAQIVDAADRLFYQHGYAYTSFADIAGAVKISRGNFYYHFKSKDEILAAVIDARQARTQSMLDAWRRQERTPAGRLGRFARMMVDNRADIRRFGCPVGTLCSELAKLAHPAQRDAGMIFGLFRDWLRRQFAELGAGADADMLALHLLARSQGIASLATAVDDEAFIEREVALIGQWLAQLEPAAAPKPSRPRRPSTRSRPSEESS